MIGDHLIHIHSALREVEEGLAALDQILLEEGGVAWAPDTPDSQAPRLARQALTHIYHRDTGEELPLSGLIHAPDRALALVPEINAAKDRLKSTILALRQDSGLKNAGVNRLAAHSAGPSRDPAVVEALKAIKAQRLNLLSAYRHLTVLPDRLESVSWSWARQRAITRVSLDEAQVMAENLHDHARETALSLLAGLDPQEPLARVKPVAPHLRVNLVYQVEDPTTKQLERTRKATTAATVFLMPQTQLPRVRWPGDTPPPARQHTRSDAKIEAEPFIYALNLYRYMDRKSTQ